MIPLIFSAYGSSPRVWGILADAIRNAGIKRFIPTRVGNTAKDSGKLAFPAVHPHACGEYNRIMTLEQAENGSSPRVWGILLAAVAELEVQRFIPTRVGNT